VSVRPIARARDIARYFFNSRPPGEGLKNKCSPLGILVFSEGVSN